MLHHTMVEASHLKVPDQKTLMTNLFVALNALGPEIQRLATELRQLQQQSDEAFNASFEAAEITAEENLKQAIKEAQESARKQIVNDLRAKYLKELETALAENAMGERRHAAAVKQLE